MTQFAITRTSTHGDESNPQPHPLAEYKTQARSQSSKGFTASLTEWLNCGTSHYISEGVAYRSISETRWMINIGTTMDLVDLSLEVGPLIIDGDSIEIYDKGRD